MKNNCFTTKLIDVIEYRKNDVPDADLEGVFLVMDYIENDIKSMLDLIQPENFTFEHIKILTYNILCGLNFMHSANLMHRDIKP